jgi:ATP-binding cassette subfamily B protein
MERSFFSSLLNILKRNKFTLLKGVFLVFFSNLLLIVNPLVFRSVIQELQLGVKPPFILMATSLLVSFATVSAIFKYGMRITFISTSRVEERRLRSYLFDKIQGQSMAFFDQFGVGELLSRLTNDISAYRDVLGPGIMYPVFFLTLVIPGILALYFISPSLANLAMLPLLAIPIVNFLVRAFIYRDSKKIQELLGTLSGMTQEHFSSLRILKSYVAEDSFFDHFSKKAAQMIGLNVKLSFTQGLLFPFFTFLTRLITVVLVVVSGSMILKGWGELSVADFVSFMWIQSYIFFPVIMLSWLVPVYQRGRAAYDRLVEIDQVPVEVQDHAKHPLKIPPNATISVKNLTFFYPKASRASLCNLSLDLKGGSFVGICGPIGSGKTTFLRVLNREYEVPYGKIFFGQPEIHDYPLESFHQEIVTVEQVPFLFSRSIAENVQFGNEGATHQDLEAASRFADLHETVLEFPEQYQTVIGERGVTLSGGQKQRVAIARALLVNRSILLLDDIFSSVDTQTEERIFRALKQNLAGKTVLLVSSRAKVLEGMDRILYFQEGQVIEDGTPKELVEKKGHFAALLELQKMRQR